MAYRYIPFNDGCGIAGYHLECHCGHITSFSNVCEECGFEGIDPDDWYEEIFESKG